MLSYRSAQAQGIDLFCARSRQSPGARAHRGTRGEDVVYEEDRTADAASGRVGALDVGPSLLGREVYLIPRPAHSLQCIRNGDVYPAGDAASEEGGI